MVRRCAFYKGTPAIMKVDGVLFDGVPFYKGTPATMKVDDVPFIKVHRPCFT